MGVGFINEIKQREAVFPIDFKHMLILGETGSGKTTGIINPNLLYRMKEGHGILLFDYKGHYHMHVKALAKRAGRLNDVMIIGEPWGENINVLGLLNENGIEEVLKVVIEAGENNKYWENSAVNLALEILKIIKNFRLSGINDLEYNFKTLFEISSNAKRLKKFKESIIPLMLEKYDEFDEDECVYVNNIKEALETLDNIADDEELDSVIKGTRRLISDVLATLSKPISKIASCDFLNKEGIDPAEELDKGKIIIIKTNFLGETELSILVKAIFHKLHDRFVEFKTPVSIFIDEAQKVLNPKFELPIDILREIKVDVILSTQSIANLENKLGKLKTYELLANLTTKVYLKGQDSLIKKGFYRINDNDEVIKFKPLYINKNEYFEAEYEYQEFIKIREKLKFIHLPIQKGIFIYSTFLDEYTLIFEDISGKREYVKYITNDYITDCNKGKEFLNSLKKKIKKFDSYSDDFDFNELDGDELDIGVKNVIDTDDFEIELKFEDDEENGKKIKDIIKKLHNEQISDEEYIELARDLFAKTFLIGHEEIFVNNVNMDRVMNCIEKSDDILFKAFIKKLMNEIPF